MTVSAQVTGITVGAGGAGGGGNGVGASGGNSIFSSITSNGGGGGAPDGAASTNGGSGGGNGRNPVPSGVSISTGTGVPESGKITRIHATSLAWA